MSTSRTQQLLDSSVDSLGISIATGNGLSERVGAIYRHSSLAAGVLVHNHVMNDGTTIALFGKAWQNVTVGTAAQVFIDYEEIVEPTWVAFNPLTGSVAPGPWSRSQTIPIANAYEDRVLRGACSLRNNLFMVELLDDLPFVQMIRLDRSVNTGGEEFVPIIETEDEEIRFDNGCYINGNHLVVIGHGVESGSVYECRKEWARIGILNVPWEFSTATGWYPAGTSGQVPSPEPILTEGPCSAWLLRGELYLTTVEEVEGLKVSFFWKKSRRGDWQKFYETPLEVDDMTYEGYGARLQGHLYPNQAALNDSKYAIPYITTAKLVEDPGGEDEQSSLVNSWELLNIR